jgi:NADH:ubiquinone oxidoreductase subunit F (NADH-binding)
VKDQHFLIPGEAYGKLASYERARGGALARARAMSPAEIVEAITRAGLRGRGGAGFPTGVKWRTVQTHPCRTRSVICNAAEGEPGTFKDRFLLRKNPYAVLEGLLIAARAIETNEIIIGIRASFTQEIARLRAAIDEAAKAGWLGSATITIFEGPEEYLFGEEKALLNAIEEGEPLPREAHYPPYERGLHATPGSPNPALVNNAETFAHVPSIVRLGAESFRKLGTEDTPGTVIFTMSGDVKRPGVYECEAGISLRELIVGKAKGPAGAPVKLVAAGTASGIIPAEALDTPADFGSLAKIGSGLGSAGFVVFDETRPAPRIAQALLRFLYVESCDQCPPCKLGLGTASAALDEIFTPGEASPDDLERALQGARSAPQGNRCYLPQQGAQLLKSLVERYRGEFESQLSRPWVESPRIPIPLLRDYDEATHRFELESAIERKQPDWTFLSETPPPPPRRKLRTGRLAIRLDPEIAARLEERARREGLDLDRLVNRFIRSELERGEREG